MGDLVKWVGAIVLVVGTLFGLYLIFAVAFVPGVVACLSFMALGAMTAGISEVIYLLERIKDKVNQQ